MRFMRKLWKNFWFGVRRAFAEDAERVEVKIFMTMLKDPDFDDYDIEMQMLKVPENERGIYAPDITDAIMEHRPRLGARMLAPVKKMPSPHDLYP